MLMELNKKEKQTNDLIVVYKLWISYAVLLMLMTNLLIKIWNRNTIFTALREPPETTIRSMRPTDLSQALQFSIPDELLFLERYSLNKLVTLAEPYHLTFLHQILITSFRWPIQINIENSILSQLIPLRQRNETPPQRFPRTSEVFSQKN